MKLNRLIHINALVQIAYVNWNVTAY